MLVSFNNVDLAWFFVVFMPAWFLHAILRWNVLERRTDGQQSEVRIPFLSFEARNLKNIKKLYFYFSIFTLDVILYPNKFSFYFWKKKYISSNYSCLMKCNLFLCKEKGTTSIKISLMRTFCLLNNNLILKNTSGRLGAVAVACDCKSLW